MNSEDINGADNAQHTPVSGAGATLRAAREELRFDLAHVAAETRIPVRHLEAIEQGDFESLPSRAYAIGFSRTFAKVVGLDPAEITDAVRAELADGSMRRSAPSSAMEPGDPARLPSAGLTWAAAAAVLVLGVGSYAFFNAYFGAGTEPGALDVPAPSASSAPVASAPQAAPSAAISGPVVLTALEEGIWVRLYEEGGERLFERTMALGETVTVPATATDPRINTGRPDALSITVGGQPVAKISDRAQTISGVQVSASALTNRTEAVADQAAAAPREPATIVAITAHG
ncbi:MAG: helix-turn-helix domain-containing protein [Sphingomonadales bacterium]|nr:helix-turn-helix domain-containing protein [Sphingomonadales bacterium]NCQ22156.1 helix-turn-helix domain-containing protein [Sphingomonadales bacterium]NCT03361.1 helix-turn-helix domain-containing protein [Sphingomonadales bacterium]